MSDTPVWSVEKAWDWYGRLPWLIGANFYPRTAINQLEMWQAETFDPKTIDEELGWAEAIGFNFMRVYLHDLVWESDRDGFLKRMDEYLGIADRHGVHTLFVFFDDCHNRDPKAGPQPDPRPGIHNSGWFQSPGDKVVRDPSQWGRLERYVVDVLKEFSGDERVVCWDLYNEPGNRELHGTSLPLVEAVYDWALGVRPSQPVSIGIWTGPVPENVMEVDWRNEETDWQLRLNALIASRSDVVTFHHYGPADSLKQRIEVLKNLGRPMICTEYMARSRDSRFQTHVPIFREENVGCCNWGLVKGRSNTIYPWGSPLNAPEPDPWFHDVFHPDGRPYDPEEIEVIKKATGK